MRSSSFLVVAVALLVGVAWAEPAAAQFRNNGVQPTIGYLGLGSLWDRAINGGSIAEQNADQGPDAAVDEGWNMTDQPTVGVAYFRAIGYQLWWDNSFVVGVGTTILDVDDEPTPLVTTSLCTGLRYNFLEERHRPFVSGHLHYLQVIALGGAVPPIPANVNFGNTPFFIGFRPGVGYEWVFGDEQSLQAEISLAGFLVFDDKRGLGNLFLPASVARIGYNIYF